MKLNLSQTSMPVIITQLLGLFLLQSGDQPITPTPLPNLTVEASQSQEHALVLVLGAIVIVVIIILGVLLRRPRTR